MLFQRRTVYLFTLRWPCSGWEGVLRRLLPRAALILTNVLLVNPFAHSQSAPGRLGGGTRAAQSISQRVTRNLPNQAFDVGEAEDAHLAGTADHLPPGLGWHELPNTQLAPDCPSVSEIQGNTGCRSVIIAWNGGVADQRRDRLIVWGGGHADYFGNEVYALDLRSLTVQRLTDPSPISNVNSCPEAYPDGRPSARHTYNGLVYVPEQDAMFSIGGSKSSCGSLSNSIWKLDLGTMKWTLMEPHHGDAFGNTPGISADYDPNTHVVFFSDTESFFRYDPATNTVKKLSDLHGVDYHQGGIIDPERKLFLMIGYSNQFWSISIASHSRYDLEDWSKQVHGCEKLLRVPAPGLAYDPVQHGVVGWAGGNSVFLFDAGKKVCTERAYPGGPGMAQEKGTYGRFRYFPALGVFAVINDLEQTAFVLRMVEN